MNHKNGNNMETRRDDGTFKKGHGGRTKGSRNRTTIAVQNLLDDQTEAITQAAIHKALEGDTAALRLCLERICPPRKDSTVQFNLPVIATASEATSAASSILNAVSEGELTPLEATAVMGLVDSYRRTLEATELEERLSKLEALA